MHFTMYSWTSGVAKTPSFRPEMEQSTSGTYNKWDTL